MRHVGGTENGVAGGDLRFSAATVAFLRADLALWRPGYRRAFEWGFN